MIIAMPILLILVALSIVLFQRHQVLQARRDWKDEAISLINSLANDPNWVLKEKAHVASADVERDPAILAEEWLSTRMILMSNGEWLVYQNHCSKEKPKLNAKPRRPVSDIFIAKGSNGKWYYSTCHFCVGMIVITGDDPPPSIAKFARRYHLREFDGQSDECLQQTEFMPGRDWD